MKMTHTEIAKKAGISRSCSPYDLFIVTEGLQCGNCGAVTTDHGKTWKSNKVKGCVK
jgi:uncharacterized Zn finger protein